MGNLIQDIRYCIRILIKSPGFTAVAVLSLALGIGANTAVFTLIDKLLLHAPAVERPEQLISVFTSDAKNPGNLPMSHLNYLDYRDPAPALEIPLH